ncbi:MAG TPA: IS701 family transposase [Lacipirellulaceae bacterium]|nr:IS701 family transposase [Lacipirellulaceae bacterium]
MSRLGREGSEARFASFVEALVGVIGHADRATPLRDYCTGLLMPADRKSVEPMAAVTAPSRVAAQHQSLLHFVGQSAWSDEAVLAKVRELTLPAIERSRPVEAWIVDDTSFPKKGRHSVGVTRQYSGQLGKQDNCQVAVSLSVTNDAGSLPVAYRLYLPQDWAADPERRSKAGVPEGIVFRTKPEIALDQIGAALEARIPRGVVLMDAGYGADTALRTGVSALGLTYVAGVQPHTSVWTRSNPPPQIKPWSGRGRPPTRLRRDPHHQPQSAKETALSLPADAWTTIPWREGSVDQLTSRFARLRVRAAHRDYHLGEPRPEEWLLVEWPPTEKEPTKYWLSTLPENIAFERLVELAKLRWRIERDYQELKQELGLGHYEGRGWRGFHHHATLCIAAYAFLVAERAAIPPSGRREAAQRTTSRLPAGHRPRGAPDQAGAPRADLHRDRAATAHDSPGPQP